MQESGLIGGIEMFGTKLTAWRLMFVVGTVPALLALVIRRRLKEPERWQAVAHEGVAAKQLGSYGQLFGDPRWRKNALVGLCLAFSGVVGLWGIGFFAPDLVRSVFTQALSSARALAARSRGQACSCGPASTRSCKTWAASSASTPSASSRTGSAGAARSPSRSSRRCVSTAFFFWYVGRSERHLLDDAADGLLPVGAVRRLRDLFPGAVPHAPAQHGRVVLLQRRAASSPRSARSCSAAHQRRLHGPTATNAEPMRYAGVVMCASSCSAWPCSRLPRKPREDRCRNEVRTMNAE